MRHARIGTDLVLNVVGLKVLSSLLQNLLWEELIVLFAACQQEAEPGAVLTYRRKP